jgi:hydrogenase-1 operon protein HyaF
MRTFEPRIVEVADTAAVQPALRLMRRVARACETAALDGAGALFPLAGLDARNRALVAETMGEGEVACRVGEGFAAQESVFAGVWTVRDGGGESLEVGPAPRAVRERAFEPQRAADGLSAQPAPGVVNAPSVITELLEKSALFRPGAAPHVINLTLLPHTPEDLDHFDAALGKGAATLLSRGYGDCRVEATATPWIWRVRFFNSMGALILDTFEVTDIPEAALAAAEDFEDSAARLDEALEAIR